MRSWRFVFSRRWVLFTLVVIGMAYGTVWLGNWQFGRLTTTKAKNALIRTNEQAAPVDVSTVLPPGHAVGSSLEWRRVSATGRYDQSRTVVVRYRTRNGNPGFDVVVPLQLANGSWLIVDRGWLISSGSSQVPTLPPPPAGQVTVTGYLRVDGTGSSTVVTDRSTRSINSQRIGQAIGTPVLGGFLNAATETPPASTPLLGPSLPDLGNGPHFFYGLQWWFFGILAVFGYFYLMYDEWRDPTHSRRRSRTKTKGEDDEDDPAGPDAQITGTGPFPHRQEA